MLKAAKKNHSVKRPSERSPSSSEPKKTKKKSLQEIYSNKTALGLTKKPASKSGKKAKFSLKDKSSRLILPCRPEPQTNNNKSPSNFSKKRAKISSKGLNCKFLSDTNPSPKTQKDKIFDLVKARLRKQRHLGSSSQEKMAKEIPKKMHRRLSGPNSEKFEKVYFNYPLSVREDYFRHEEDSKNPDFFKTYKSKRTVSLIDTDDLSFEQENLNDCLKKTKKIINLEPHLIQAENKPKNDNFNNEKILILKQNRAARVIQKNLRKYLKNLKEKKTEKLQNLVKEQLSWKEAEILTIEYLKQKEIEDLQFLSGILGRNPELEEMLENLVQQRYDNFSNFFKESFQGIEAKLKSINQEISEKNIQDKKEVVNKLIQETNTTCLKSKEQIESLIKVAKEENCLQIKSPVQMTVDSNQIDPPILSPLFNDLNFPDLSSLIIEEKEELEKTEDISIGSILTESKVPILKLEEVKPASPVMPSEKRIETSSFFIYEFLKKYVVISKIEKVNEWIHRDPLEELQKIQNDFNSFDDRYPFIPVLDIESLLEKSKTPVLSTDRAIEKADKIHKKMLLSASDEILQYFRPYGIIGHPQIWSSKTRGLNFSKHSTEEIVECFLNVMADISLTQIGKIPTEDMIQSNGHLNEIALSNARALSLELALKKDVIENEWMWTDYEFEETQVKLDLSDIILSDLIDDLQSCLETCNPI